MRSFNLIVYLAQLIMGTELFIFIVCQSTVVSTPEINFTIINFTIIKFTKIKFTKIKIFRTHRCNEGQILQAIRGIILRMEGEQMGLLPIHQILPADASGMLHQSGYEIRYR